MTIKITKKAIGKGCGKVDWNITCGSYSIKHDEYYYCDKCFNKLDGEKK